MRSFSPDFTSTYKSRGMESNLTSPVAGITRTSIWCLSAWTRPQPIWASGLHQGRARRAAHPRPARLLWMPLLAALSGFLAASFLASSLASLLASGESLRVDWSLVLLVGSRLPDAASSFFVLCAGARFSSAGIVPESPCASNPSNAAGTKPGDSAVSAVPAESAPSPFNKTAACVPIPKNRHDRTNTARSRRRRYRARLNRLRFERARLLVFFKSPAVTRSWQAIARERKPTKLTGL